jgi:hypothetical protein
MEPLFMAFCKVIYKTRLTIRFCPVLECAVWVADETSNRTIERPVLAQMINQNYILIIKLINQCGLVVRIADAMLSRVLINIESVYVFDTKF